MLTVVPPVYVRKVKGTKKRPNPYFRPIEFLTNFANLGGYGTISNDRITYPICLTLRERIISLWNVASSAQNLLIARIASGFDRVTKTPTLSERNEHLLHNFLANPSSKDAAD